MSSQEFFILKAAENSEKAARKKADEGKPAESAKHWAAAADFYVKARVFNKVILCLENADQLKARAIELLSVFDPKKVISILAQRGFREELALGQLHLQNRGEARDSSIAFETCCSTAEAQGTEKTHAIRLLKGAMLAAAWNQDEVGAVRSADLALSQVSLVDDKALILLVKTAASGEFTVVEELTKTAIPAETAQKPYTPFQLRLLAVDYVYRGIKLGTLLDAMAAIPALRRCADLYRKLLDGIDSGLADHALEEFVSNLAAHADHPDPRTPLNSWDDMERRFPQILYVQPEYLVAGILWDQVWSTRAGVQEIRDWIAKARSDQQSTDWREAKELFERIAGHSLFLYLPKSTQAEAYQLACAAAFEAEDWDRLDQWAAVLEAQHGTKDVLHKTVGTTSNEGGREEKLRRAAESYESSNRDRAGEAWAELKDHAQAALFYTIAGDEHREREDYASAKASYLRAGLQYTHARQNDDAQNMRQNVRDCEEQVRELDRTGVMRDHVEATRDQARASREGSVVISQSLRDGFIATSRALINGLSALGEAQRQAAITSAEIVFRGIEQLAASQTAGFAQLADAIREGDTQNALATYAGLKEIGRQNAEAIGAFKDALARSEANTMGNLKLFDSMTRMLPGGGSASRSLPHSTTQRIVDIEARDVAGYSSSQRPIRMESSICLLGSDPPGACVLNITKNGGVYQQCQVAMSAMTRRWHPFSEFSSKVLRQGHCPLPNSLGIIQRNLWLKTCYLADGREHKKP